MPAKQASQPQQLRRVMDTLLLRRGCAGQDAGVLDECLWCSSARLCAGCRPPGRNRPHQLLGVLALLLWLQASMSPAAASRLSCWCKWRAVTRLPVSAGCCWWAQPIGQRYVCPVGTLCVKTPCTCSTLHQPLQHLAAAVEAECATASSPAYTCATWVLRHKFRCCWCCCQAQELDEAARRRLPKQLYIPLPCADARRAMVTRQLAKVTAALSPAGQCCDACCLGP